MKRMILASALLAACSSHSSGDQPDLSSPPDLLPAVQPPDMADWGAPSTMYPAPHEDPPQVVSSNGPVMSAPLFVPVFFGGDDTATMHALEQFTAGIGSTPYWTAVGMEYGVGAATSATPVELTEAAATTLTDAQIQQWLGGKLNDANDTTLPKPTKNTVYVLYYPSGVTITLQNTMSCVQGGFGGYHSNFSLTSGTAVAYAVVPRCASDPALGQLATPVDVATASASHEMIEAATDPYPQSKRAYSSVDDAHYYWTFALGGSETGDMCAQNRSSFTKFDGFNYYVQRSWSNAAALAGHDPCQPALPGEVYFNSVPQLDDDVALAGGTMKGVQIPVGMSKTIGVDLFSDADTSGPWTVKAVDYAALAQGTAPGLDFAWDRDSGQNGERLHLTVTVNTATQYGVGLFVIESKLGTTTNLWFGLVGEQ